MSCLLVYEERPIPLPFAMINKMTEESVSRYVAIIMEGTSLQNRIKMAAKDMATIPTNTPRKFLTKGCSPFYFHICSDFCKYHSQQNKGRADTLFNSQKFSTDPVTEKGIRYGSIMKRIAASLGVVYLCMPA
jgi:hypothetical protein